MAQIEIKFLCSIDNDDYITVESTDENEINIVITDAFRPSCVILDKSTAIKFAKTLRTEINKIQ